VSLCPLCQCAPCNAPADESNATSPARLLHVGVLVTISLFSNHYRLSLHTQMTSFISSPWRVNPFFAGRRHRTVVIHRDPLTASYVVTVERMRRICLSELADFRLLSRRKQDSWWPTDVYPLEPDRAASLYKRLFHNVQANKSRRVLENISSAKLLFRLECFKCPPGTSNWLSEATVCFFFVADQADDNKTH
jgi:hypothetical protein